VALIDSKIVLIVGNMLAHLMIDYHIGVTTFAAYEMKRIDSDYFVEE
jgi:restriction system protein